MNLIKTALPEDVLLERDYSYSRPTVTPLKIKAPIDYSTLNKEQCEYIKAVRNLVRKRKPHLRAKGDKTKPEINDDHVILCTGPGGTGKTYTTNKLVAWGIKSGLKVCICAPTNRAVKVAADMSEVAHLKEVTFKTLQAICGIRPKTNILPDGSEEVVYVKDKDTEPTIYSFDLVIIDEISIADVPILRIALQYAHQIAIVMLGDQAQLPPVSGDDDVSPAFLMDKYFPTFRVDRVDLKQVKRQSEGSPILEYCNHIREGKNTHHFHTSETSEGIVFTDQYAMSKLYLKEVVKKMFDTDSFRENPDAAKILCWRNKSKEEMNVMARELIYGKLVKQIVRGEFLIVQEPNYEFIEKEINEETTVSFSKTRYYNTQALRVDDFKPSTITYNLGPKSFTFQTYKLYVSTYDGRRKGWIKSECEVLDVCETQRMDKFLKMLRLARSTAWKSNDMKQYNILKMLIRKITEFDLVWYAYPYAENVYKIQGGTVGSVISMEHDMRAVLKSARYIKETKKFRPSKRNNAMTYRAMTYVAASRAVKNLVSLRSGVYKRPKKSN